MYSKYKKNHDIHYVIAETVGTQLFWVNVFDYENLMLYLLDATQNLSDKEIFYIDKLCRKFKVRELFFEGCHKLDKSKLLKQAYEYEHTCLNEEEYNEVLGVYVAKSREWADMFRSVPIHESEWEWDNRFGYILPYKKRRKSHKQGSYGCPKHIWNKIKTEYFLATADSAYEEDYSSYFTHKGRHLKSVEMGWYDDYYRRRKSAGWKESSKRKHQWKGDCID